MEDSAKVNIKGINFNGVLTISSRELYIHLVDLKKKKHFCLALDSKALVNRT